MAHLPSPASKEDKEGKTGQLPEPLVVERLKHVPSYQEFLRDFLLPNKPCILPPDLISDWPARHWAEVSSLTNGKEKSDTSSSSLHPAFDLLKQQYGDHIVPVVTTAGESRDSIAGTSQYESAPSEREEMTLSEAVDRLHEACRLREQATEEERDTTPPAPLIYIKDWHLVRQEKLRHSREQIDNPVLPYTTPDLFLDDWMNNESFLPQQSSEEAAAAVSAAIPDDFRFCYAGLRGTTTGLHRDVYTSYSWSTNLVGRKRWVLYSPQLSPLLRRLLEQGRGLAPLSAAERASLEEPESSTIVLQEEGETIFVPSDVFHTVENLEDTISLNHNWCNAVNLPRMYESIKEEMGEVQGALQDVREMLLESEKQRETDQKGRSGATSNEEEEEEEEEEGKEQRPPLPWQVEYWRLIQQVSRSDAGWDWLQFWQMVQRWLDPSSRACPANLHPDLESFVYPRVATMIQDFRQREEWQWLDAEVRTCVEDCSILIAPACR